MSKPEKSNTSTPATQKQAAEFFEATSKGRYITPSNQDVNLAMGVPANAKDLYLSANFPYLKLKKGAEELFQETPEADIVRVIQFTPHKSDIKILQTLVKSEEGKKAIVDLI